MVASKNKFLKKFGKLISDGVKNYKHGKFTDSQNIKMIVKIFYKWFIQGFRRQIKYFNTNQSIN